MPKAFSLALKQEPASGGARPAPALLAAPPCPAVPPGAANSEGAAAPLGTGTAAAIKSAPAAAKTGFKVKLVQSSQAQSLDLTTLTAPKEEYKETLETSAAGAARTMDSARDRGATGLGAAPSRPVGLLEAKEEEKEQKEQIPLAAAPSMGSFPEVSAEDLKNLRLRQDHAVRPLWVCPSGRILFENFHPKAAQVTDFLIAVAEPVSRPELLHEYQITVLSLTAAISTGIDVETIIKVLERLSKNDLEAGFVEFLRSRGQSIGKLKMVLRNGRHFLEGSDKALLEKLCAVEEVAQSLLQNQDEQVEGQEDVSIVEVDSEKVEIVKGAAHRIHLPLVQEYEYKLDKQETNPELPAILRSSIDMRPYQKRALSKMFSLDGVAKSGIVVLPCGAGKTLVGIAACVRIGRRALVLTTTSVAVDQWRRQFQLYTTIPPEDVYVLTSESKRPIEDAERKACVVISTYSMLGFGGTRSGESELVISQLEQLEWGLLVVDEVQVMPARTFRTVATKVKSHCILGLTATLVREDNLIYDLHWLIGPKLYEASWQQLQDDGYLARVNCLEVWCEMAKPFFGEYLRAQASKDIPGTLRTQLQRALWTCNPNKLKVCEYLVRFHEQRGDKVLVFSDNIFILEQFSKKLGRYFICGKVGLRERMQILSEFQESASCNTIFLSQVGDNAIDLPVANVLIQIASHYGSRRQEAQRLGRILRPKPRAANAPGKFNAFFWTLISRDTQEMFYANRRQQFLVEQGYNYTVLRGQRVTEMDAKDLHYGPEEAQLELLKQVLESVRHGDATEKDEVEVVDEVRPPARGIKREPTGAPAAAVPPQAPRPVEEKVSLASLSGGLDGAYSVASIPAKKLKASRSNA